MDPNRDLYGPEKDAADAAFERELDDYYDWLDRQRVEEQAERLAMEFPSVEVEDLGQF